MLRAVDGILGYRLLARDGELGKVRDFYFDDRHWTVRYLVADTGGWFSRRRVLISPVSIGSADWLDRTLSVELTREQVERSPGAETDRPVSRQQELELARYYQWPLYWNLSSALDARPTGIPAEDDAAPSSEDAQAGEDSSLRSVAEVKGYSIQARDGSIGKIDDFIVDDASWSMPFVVVDTGSWLSGKKVLITPVSIDEVDWGEAEVRVDLKRQRVRSSPEYRPHSPVNRRFEEQLYDYYGRPKSWPSRHRR